MPATNLNIQDKIGKCDNCNAVFSFESKVATGLNQLLGAKTISRPEGVDLIYFKDELKMTIDQPPAMLHTYIACIVPFIALLLISSFFAKGAGWALFPGLVATVISAFGIFKLIRHRQDKIFVTIDKHKMYMQWRPKNLVRDKSYDFKAVEQIYVKATNMGIALFMVINDVNGQKHKQLIGRFSNLIKAKYVEQELECYMGIENRKVMGELD